MIFLEKYYQFTNDILAEATGQVSKLNKYKLHGNALKEMRSDFLDLTPEDFLRVFSTVEVWDVRLAEVARKIKEERKMIDEYIETNSSNSSRLFRLIGLELDPDTGQLIRSTDPVDWKYHDIFLKRGSGATKAGDIDEPLDPKDFVDEIPKFSPRVKDNVYLNSLKMETADATSVPFDADELDFKNLAEPELVKQMEGMQENRYFAVDKILESLAFKYRFEIPESDSDTNIVLRDIAEKIPSDDDEELYNNLQASWFRQNTQMANQKDEIEDRSGENVENFVDAFILINNAVMDMFYRVNAKGKKVGLSKKEFQNQYGTPDLKTVRDAISDKLPFPVTTQMIARVLFPEGKKRILLKNGRFVPNSVAKAWDDVLFESKHFNQMYDIILEKSVKGL